MDERKPLDTGSKARRTAAAAARAPPQQQVRNHPTVQGTSLNSPII